MARRVKALKFVDQANPANPEFFGEDIVPLAWEAVGLATTAFSNDKLVSPAVRQVVPIGGDAGTQLVDALSTGVTAWLLGEGIGMVDGRIGRRFRRGGMLLAVGKFLAIPLPGFVISGSLPSGISFPFLGAGAKQPVAALTNGNGAAVQTRLGFGSMGI